MNCFRYLNKETIEDAKRLTPYEYSLLMKAESMKRVDSEYEIHLQAWVNHQVKAEKEQGKKTVPIYKKFDQFFNYEERIDSILKPKKEEKKLTNLERLMLQANS